MLTLVDSDFDDIWGDEDVVGYMHSQQQLNQLIDDERQKMLDAGKPPRIVLLGFSQGAPPLTPFSLSATS